MLVAAGRRTAGAGNRRRRRSSFRSIRGALVVPACALALLACDPVAASMPSGAPPAGTSTTAAAATPDVPSAAYVDVTGGSTGLTAAPAGSAGRNVVLAFLLAAGSRCAPGWDARPVADPALLSVTVPVLDATRALSG